MNKDRVHRVKEFHKYILKRLHDEFGATLTFREQYRCPSNLTFDETLDFFVKEFDHSAMPEDNYDPASIKCFPFCDTVFCTGSEIPLDIDPVNKERICYLVSKELKSHPGWDVDVDRLIYKSDKANGSLVYNAGYGWVNYYGD